MRRDPPTPHDLEARIDRPGQAHRRAAGKIWVNPDCGLKTRGWPEVEEELENMVSAAQRVREEVYGRSA